MVLKKILTQMLPSVPIKRTRRVFDQPTRPTLENSPFMTFLVNTKRLGMLVRFPTLVAFNRPLRRVRQNVVAQTSDRHPAYIAHALLFMGVLMRPPFAVIARLKLAPLAFAQLVVTPHVAIPMAAPFLVIRGAELANVALVRFALVDLFTVGTRLDVIGPLGTNASRKVAGVAFAQSLLSVRFYSSISYENFLIF